MPRRAPASTGRSAHSSPRMRPAPGRPGPRWPASLWVEDRDRRGRQRHGRCVQRRTGARVPVWAPSRRRALPPLRHSVRRAWSDAWTGQSPGTPPLPPRSEVRDGPGRGTQRSRSRPSPGTAAAIAARAPPRRTGCGRYCRGTRTAVALEALCGRGDGAWRAAAADGAADPGAGAGYARGHELPALPSRDVPVGADARSDAVESAKGVRLEGLHGEMYTEAPLEL